MGTAICDRTWEILDPVVVISPRPYTIHQGHHEMPAAAVQMRDLGNAWKIIALRKDAHQWRRDFNAKSSKHLLHASLCFDLLAPRYSKDMNIHLQPAVKFVFLGRGSATLLSTGAGSPSASSDVFHILSISIISWSISDPKQLLNIDATERGLLARVV